MFIKLLKKVKLTWELKRILKKPGIKDPSLAVPAEYLLHLSELVINNISLLDYKKLLSKRIVTLYPNVDKYYQLLILASAKIKIDQPLDPLDFEGMSRSNTRLIHFLTWSDGDATHHDLVIEEFCFAIKEFANSLILIESGNTANAINNLRRLRPQRKNLSEILICILEICKGD